MGGKLPFHLELLIEETLFNQILNKYTVVKCDTAA